MAKQRYINTRFWQDNYISNLDPSEKLLFLYCLTSPSTNISGAYEIPLKIIAADTGYDKDMILKIFARFEKDDKIIYKDGWLFIVNFIKHQSSKSSKVQIGITENLKDAPQWIKNRVSIPYTDPIIYSNSNSNSNSNQDQDTEKKKEYSPEALEISSYYWKTMSKPLSLINLEEIPNNWIKPLDALLKKGIPLQTIKNVIDFASKDDFWRKIIISTDAFNKQFEKVELQLRNTPPPKQPDSEVDKLYPKESRYREE